MEAIGALFATVLGSGTAAAATGATAAASIGSTALTVLQGAGTVFSALATLGSGAAASAAAEGEALQHKFESREEYIAGRETSAALKAELARTVSNQAVAYAAGGVNLGSVSVETAKQQATEDAEKELSINANQSLSRSLQRQRAARVARARGRTAQMTSILSVGQQVANFGIDVAKRG